MKSSRKVGDQRLIEYIGIVWGFLETIVKTRHATKDFR
jgi:hypothetical protein